MRPENKKRIIIVLGMHRSGTSAITRGLQVLGVDLGNNLYGAMDGVNNKGFWEDIDLNRLNAEMLAELDTDWHFLKAVTDDDVNFLRQKGYFLRAVELLRKKVSHRTVFGFKDPRIAKLLLFWNDVFSHCQLDVSYLMIVRHPLSVVRSLEKRNEFSSEKSYYLWLGHVLRSLIDSGNNKRLLIDYDLLLSSPENELNRVATAFDLPINSDELDVYKNDFLEKGLRHTKYKLNDLKLDVTCPPIVYDIYSSLLDVSTDKIRLDSKELNQQVQQWSTIFNNIHPAMMIVDKLYEERLEQQLQQGKKQEQLESQQEQLESQQEQLNAQQGQLEKFISEAAEMKTRLEQSNNLIQLFQQSFSWRITEPVRRCGLFMRRIGIKK